LVVSPLLAPRYWGGHLLMVLAVAAAVGLGLWQYDAWGAQRAAEARDLSRAEPVPLDSVLTSDGVLTGENVGRPVELSGQWLPESTLYVADRRLEGRTGYWVMTPVRVGDSALPVVRGWSAEPRAAAPEGDVEVTGWLQASEGSNLTDDDPRDDVIPEMRIASVVQHVDVDLYGAYAVADEVVPATATEGLEPVSPESVPEVSGTTALRNLLYAVQWWIFAGFGFYIWWRWCRDTLAGLREAHSRAEDPTGEQVASGA
jgi:cytochrome oxidase assembly protein ShyY1